MDKEMDDKFGIPYMTDEERKYLEESLENDSDFLYDADNLDWFESDEENRYKKNIVTKRKNDYTKRSSTLVRNTSEDFKKTPVIYEGSQIDMDALHELLKSQSLTDEKANYVCNVVKNAVPTLSDKILTSDLKNKLIDTEKDIKKLFTSLKGLAHLDKELVPYVKSFDTFVDPADFLFELQYTIQQMLKSYFPNGKVNPAHLHFSHTIGQLWRASVGKPKIYLDSPFIQFLSICTCTTQEATIKRIQRQGMTRKIKAYAPF